MKNRGIIVASVLVAFGVVGLALVVRGGEDSQETPTVAISEKQLTEANGKDGQQCWLVIDGVVYEIEQGFKWSDGEHTESADAYCGADMSSVIDQAPHGRTKLEQLKKVGTYNK